MVYEHQRTSLLLIQLGVEDITRYVNQEDLVTHRTTELSMSSHLYLQVLMLGQLVHMAGGRLAFGKSQEVFDFLEYLITKGMGDRF